MVFFSARVNMLLRGIVVLALAVVPLTRPLDVRGQQTPEGLNVDSILAILDTIPRPFMTFTPSYTARLTGNVTSVGWTNQFSNQSPFGRRGSLRIGLDTDRKDFRLQDRLEESKALTSRLVYQLGPNMNSGLSFNNTRQFNRVIAAAGGLQDFSLNNQVANGDLAYRTRVLNDVRVDGRIEGQLNDSEQTFKRDRSARAGINGGAGYNVFGRFAAIRVRGAYAQTTASSQTGAGGQGKLGGLGGFQDSVVTRIDVRVSDSLTVAFDYSDFESERDYADQARGSTGAQQLGSQNVILEHESRRTRDWGIAMASEPWRALRLSVKFRESDQLQDFDNNNTRDSRTISDDISADFQYAPRSGTQFSLRLSNRVRTFDFGTQSLNGRDQFTKSASINFRHSFTNTLSADLTVQNAIDQAEYVRKEENPRDRDQVDTSLNLRITSQPFNPLSVNVVVTSWVTDYVNIDQSLSSDNRRKEKYDLRPSFTYAVSEHVSLNQEYGLAIEFTDHFFRPEDNFLDRNITFRNGLKTKLTTNTNVQIDYNLRLHDKGSYLIPDGAIERELEVQSEDRNDRLDTRLEYRINAHVRAEVTHEYNRRRDEFVSTGRVTYRTDTGIEGGLIGNYTVGESGKFSFNIRKVNRAGDFVSERQKDYWQVSSEFRYAF